MLLFFLQSTTTGGENIGLISLDNSKPTGEMNEKSVRTVCKSLDGLGVNTVSPRLALDRP